MKIARIWNEIGGKEMDIPFQSLVFAYRAILINKKALRDCGAALFSFYRISR